MNAQYLSSEVMRLVDDCSAMSTFRYLLGLISYGRFIVGSTFMLDNTGSRVGQASGCYLEVPTASGSITLEFTCAGFAQDTPIKYVLTDSASFTS